MKKLLYTDMARNQNVVKRRGITDLFYNFCCYQYQCNGTEWCKATIISQNIMQLSSRAEYRSAFFDLLKLFAKGNFCE